MKKKIKNKKLPEHWGHVRMDDGSCQCEQSKEVQIAWAENEIKEYQRFIDMLKKKK